MTVDTSIEDLEKSLNIPSFEEELAMSDLPGRKLMINNKAARVVKCPICGKSVMLGPHDEFSCPSAPHDVEDDNLSDIELSEFVDTVADSEIFN